MNCDILFRVKTFSFILFIYQFLPGLSKEVVTNKGICLQGTASLVKAIRNINIICLNYHWDQYHGKENVEGPGGSEANES